MENPLQYPYAPSLSIGSTVLEVLSIPLPLLLPVHKKAANRGISPVVSIERGLSDQIEIIWRTD
jgi:hypothetical protein